MYRVALKIFKNSKNAFRVSFRECDFPPYFTHGYRSDL